MQDITKVVLDAMGGDNAPAEVVKGAVDAVSSRDDIKVILVGQEAVREGIISQVGGICDAMKKVHELADGKKKNDKKKIK